MSDVLLACCKYHFPVLNTTIRVYLNTDGYPSDRAQPQDKQNFLKTLMRCGLGEGKEIRMVVTSVDLWSTEYWLLEPVFV